MLQSDGEQLHATSIPTQKAEDNFNNSKDKTNIKKKIDEIALIKIKFSQT
jgi:hypothetical protein